VLEAVGDMQRQVAVLPAMQQDIAELKQDMKVVKAAVTDLSDQVHDHERRIGDLESAR
jgi:cell division protein FtsB